MLLVPNPILPQVTPTRPTVPTGGTTITVGSGKDYAATQAGLQAAMDVAVRGDIIEIDAGVEIMVGNTALIMNRKAGTGYVWVRSSGHAAFTDGIRGGSGDTASMAKLSKTTENSYLLCPEFIESAGEMAHSWVWQGIEFADVHTTAFRLGILVTLGRTPLTASSATDPSWEPHDFYFLHCYIHGDGVHRLGVGLEASSKNCGIWDSEISNILDTSSDSQCIGAVSGTGGFIADNCKLQNATEVILWGGGGQKMSGVNMADITIRRCDLSWDQALRGSGWQLKNIFEIKTGERHLIENCTIHDCWNSGQTGHAIVLKEDAYFDAWNRVKDITFRNNKIYNASGAFSLLTVQGSTPAVHTGMSDLMIRNNVMWNLNAAEGGNAVYDGAFLESSPSNAVPGQLIRRVHVRNNTFIQDDFGLTSANSGSSVRWTNDVTFGWYDHWYIRDNVIALWGPSTVGDYYYGFSSADPSKSQQHNQQAIELTLPNYSIVGNLFIGNYTEARFPSGNTKATDYTAAMFEDFAGGDLTLASGSPGIGAGVNGGDCGANIAAVNAATAGCISGDWT